MRHNTGTAVGAPMRDGAATRCVDDPPPKPRHSPSVTAAACAQAAEAGLPTGSPDWIRAQDIALQVRAELERIRDSR